MSCCPTATPLCIRAYGPQGPCCPSPFPPACCIPVNVSCCPVAVGVRGQGGCCGKKRRREKRFRQCNFKKPIIDKRIYRNGQFMCLSFAGHIPGEMYVYGRTLATANTYAKKRLCRYTPYEFVDNDGCCSFCTFP